MLTFDWGYEIFEINTLGWFTFTKILVCFTFPKNTLLGIMLETSLYCINIVYLYSFLQPLFEIETKISNLTLNHVFCFVFRLPLLHTNVKNAVDNVLLAELPKSPGFALSSDLWSSRNND